MSSLTVDIARRRVLVAPITSNCQGNPRILSFSASIPVAFPSSLPIKPKNSSGTPNSDVKQYRRTSFVREKFWNFSSLQSYSTTGKKLAEVSKFGLVLSGGMGNTHRRAGVSHAASEDKTSTKVQVSDDEWRKKLSSEQFRVARKKGTEMAFSGQYWNEKRAGSYHCICCDSPLFSSETKFDSGTGWPSYWDKISNVAEHKDWSIPFMPRVEVVCDVCDAHLGHVFNDGPRPTGLRYCINSASLKFMPKN